MQRAHPCLEPIIPEGQGPIRVHGQWEPTHAQHLGRVPIPTQGPFILQVHVCPRPIPAQGPWGPIFAEWPIPA